MSIWYVDSSRSDNTGDGQGWSTAKKYLYQNVGADDSLLLDSGITIVAGDEIRVVNNHSEVHSSVTYWTIPGSNPNNLVKIVSCTTDDVYTPATSAQFSSVSTSLYIDGNVAYYGIYFDIGYNIGMCYNGTKRFRCVDCKLIAAGTPMAHNVGKADVWGVLENCKISSESNVYVVQFNGIRLMLKFSNCVFYVPNLESNDELFDLGTASDGMRILFEGCDFTGGGTNTVHEAIFDQSPAGGYSSQIILRHCRLSTATMFETEPAENTGECEFRLEHCYVGTATVPAWSMADHRNTGITKADSTVYRTGGAKDSDTNVSWKMTSNATATYTRPLESPPMTIWANAGSQTVTTYLASASINKEDFWIEVESPNESGVAFSTSYHQTTRPDPLVASTGMETDGVSSWEGTYGGVLSKTDTLTINPTEAGPIILRCYLAKASVDSVYVDPKIEVT